MILVIHRLWTNRMKDNGLKVEEWPTMEAAELAASYYRLKSSPAWVIVLDNDGRSSAWSCTRCTRINDASLTHCGNCTEPRYNESESPK